MIDITNYPLVLFACTFLVLWAAARIGVSLKRRKALDAEASADFSVLQTTALTLLALLIGFSFSMAASRYDQRKNLEEAEANAIGTEFVRADLLPAADATRVRGLLKAYLDQRIRFFTEQNEQGLRDVNSRVAALQAELWSAILAPAAAQPTPTVGLAVAGMNDVLNAQGYVQAAWWNRIPGSAWGLLAAIAICCNMMVGYGSRSSKTGKLLLVFPFFISIAFGFIADIDSPRQGVIRVSPQNLISLSQSLSRP